MFTHLNHLCQLTLFFIQTSVLLLLLTKLGGGVEQLLEISRVPTVLEHVDLREKLLFFLLKLSDLLLELCWVHTLLSECLSVRVNGLELSLQILVSLASGAHVLVVHELVRDLERHQELSCVRLSLQVLQPAKKPEEDVLESLLVTVDDIAAKVWVKVAGVAKHFQEATHSLFSLLLRLLLHVDGLV